MDLSLAVMLSTEQDWELSLAELALSLMRMVLPIWGKSIGYTRDHIADMHTRGGASGYIHDGLVSLLVSDLALVWLLRCGLESQAARERMKTRSIGRILRVVIVEFPS